MRKHRRFFISAPVTTSFITIPGSEYHHIVDVMRFKEGEFITLIDGKGREYEVKIVEIDRHRKKLSCKVIDMGEKETVDKEFILLQPLLRRQKMDFVIQKATELGITHIYPFQADNSISRIAVYEKQKKYERWKRIVREAVKQCGRKYMPRIEEIMELKDILEIVKDVPVKIVLIEDYLLGRPLKEINRELKVGGIVITAGPEGGFSPGEIELFKEYGWQFWHFGKTVLRAETAVVVGIGVLMYAFGYW